MRSTQINSGSDLPYITALAWEFPVGIGGFIDVETTGLSPRSDEIIELALVLFAYNRDTGEILGIVEEYAGLREPGKPISLGAAAVNGITMEDVRGKVIDDGKVLRMIERAEFLVAHNAAFDKGFVCRMYPSAAGKQWVCSMSGINWYKKGCRSRSLQKLLVTYGITTTQAHRADADVKAALRLIGLTGTDGKCYFAELLAGKDRVG